MKAREVELGLGLAGIGRPAPGKRAPSAEQVQALLAAAVEQGVRIFDTAASYGNSEEQLGRFLRQLPSEERRRLFVATKCGEEFDGELARVDHSLGGLRRSIVRSLERLPHVSLLQLHKANPRVLQDEGVLRLLADQRDAGIEHLGASVTDVESGRIALETALFDFVQLPYHAEWRDLGELFPLARARDKRMLVNRPFATGRLLSPTASDEERRAAVQRAFELVLSLPFRGAVLVGTTSAAHLADNAMALQRALASARPG